MKDYIDNITTPDAQIDALVERELQSQQRIARQLQLFRAHEDMLRRRRQTAIVASLVNITSVAALVAVAFIWQFYFPVAAAVAALVP